MAEKCVKSVRIDPIVESYYYVNHYSQEDYNYWIRKGIDRSRFQRRIDQLNVLLTPIFLKKINKTI